MKILGLLLTTKEAVERMGPEGESIINISSVANFRRGERGLGSIESASSHRWGRWRELTLER